MIFWETISAIIRSLLIMSITGSVVALLLFALKLLIKNRIPKVVQYYLWIWVLLVFLIPFFDIVTMPFNTPLTPIQNIIETNVMSNYEWEEQVALELYGMSYNELDNMEKINITYRELKKRHVFNYNFILIYIPLLGIIFFLKELVQYFIYIYKLRKNRLPALKEEQAMLPPKSPRLYRNPLATTPMLIGLFRPVIYLPDVEYTQIQLENILYHELTHWKRYDVLVKWLATLVVHLHWFNLIAYFVRKEIDYACEFACDEIVIKQLDDEGKQNYGDTLIAIAADNKKSKMIISTTMCEEKSTLKARLAAIMKNKKVTHQTIVEAIVLGVIILGTTILLGAGTISLKYSPAELKLLKVDTPPPAGLILEITAADFNDIEFHLINASDMFISNYGYVNKVEVYDGNAWQAVTNKTIDIFPQNNLQLQSGMEMYGMAGLIRENITLEPGMYRYLMVVNVHDADNNGYPVVLSAEFEVSD